jgi:LDH2 family malate/lactate/ureidoglycolate dehydrogenase
MSTAVPAKPAPVLVAADALQGFAAAIFAAAGLADDHALAVADVLVWANLRGVDTHGVSRIPRYVEMLRNGDMNGHPRWSLAVDVPAAMVLDADRAPGPSAMTHAARLAVDRARIAGISMALVRGTTHTGPLGYYTSLAAREGMAAIAMSTSGPNMAYHGARAAGVATNPLSIAVPGGDKRPLVVDTATSVISLGRIMSARRLGESLPPGVAIDRNGNPSTDPKVAEIPLPLGGPKGSGLSLLMECVVSLLAGNPIISAALEGTPEGKRHRQNGLVIAIDIARFGDVDAFRAEVARLVRDVKALPADPDAGGILMPGERGDRMFAKRSREGIPLPRPVYTELQSLAATLNVAMPA